MSNEVRVETTIDGFNVYIDDDNCWVEKGAFRSSLPFVEGEGHLLNLDTGARGPDIETDTSDKIRAWADANDF